MEKYPEEIYSTRDGGLLTGKQLRNAGAGWGRRHAYEVGYQVGYEAGKAEQLEYIEPMSSLKSVLSDLEAQGFGNEPNVKKLVERAFRAGLARNLPADPLTGFSNLTAAIKAGAPVDWERLDGLKVQCVNPDVGSLQGTLERYNLRPANISSAWWSGDSNGAYITALDDGWKGEDGWTLWVEGDIPMRRKTADQLAPGTGFLGQWRSSDEPELMVLVQFLGERTYRRVKPMVSPAGYFRPEHVEVIEEYGIGTFQNTEAE